MIAPRIADIWVYLSASPLLWLTITLIAYQGAYWLYARADFNPLLNPVPIAIVALVIALKATGTEYAAYFEGAQFVHFLLGPATVALAVPLYAQFDKLRQLLVPLGGALLAGSVTAIVSVLAIGWALGASDATLLSLVPKSVTAPIAMGIAEKLGGIPSLTAVLVILTGVSGAVMAKYVLDALRIRDFGVRGFAVGVAAHGIGTARAFQVSEEAGAFAGLGMGLNGLLTAVLVPVVVSLIRQF
ncbi:MAG TPA: LrgB family protein [Burkholderiales bacterium]|jgi:predicted murein hydrolase (TIGR00659 family)|nr:LrgB family protein [Burkholderiales bacterium]